MIIGSSSVPNKTFEGQSAISLLIENKMFVDPIQDIKDVVKTVTAFLGSVLGILTALMFLAGFVGSSTNISTLVGFIMSWVVFSIVTDELDSSIKKVLAAIGLPPLVVGLVISIIYLMQAF
jgi:predicted tellurium resistance membrane protein TerC